MAAKHTEAMKLIVKAPNQLIEDQTIDCDLTWNVLRLKEYLSEVYPSKPAISEQKLIYSGQLLTDKALLKDVLRNYEGQKAHSLHLVCMPPRGTPDTWRKSNPEPTPSSSLPQTPVQESAVPSASSASTSTSNSNNNWSWVHSTQQQLMAAASAQYPAMAAQYPAMAAYPTAMVTQMYDPVSIAQMQQVYSQYVAQYLCRLEQAGVSAEALMQVQAQQSWDNNQRQQAATPPPPPPAQPPIADEDDNMRVGRQRDWLDWFYVLSRLLVLFSIVYFYSSLKRFVLVSVLGLLLYLYHLGYFRTQQPPGAGAEVENNNRHDPAPEEQQPNRDEEEEAAEGLRRRRPAQVEEEEVPPEAPPLAVNPPTSVLTVTWTFVSSFFASLIPDRPNVV